MKKLMLAILVLSPLYQMMAQDSHYWTEQFGNRSMLLSGAVIGSVDDLGAVFYNPARLALQENPTFLISAKAYQYTTLKLKDGFGTADLDNTSFGEAPTLAAGSFNIKFLPGHKFAYAFLSRYRSSFTLGSDTEITYEFNDTWAGEETLYADLSINKTLSDEWMGFSWAYSFSDKFSLGVSNFISTLDQKTSYELFMKGQSQNNEIGSFERTRIRSLSIVSWVTKIGANYETENVSLGLTINTPKVFITGSGTSEYDESLAGYDFDQDGTIDASDDRLILNATGDVAVANKTPFSIGLGAGITLGGTKIHLSAEWFDKIDRYAVMVPEPFMAQNPDTLQVRNRVFDERKSIINFGAGVEFKIKEKISGYLSFATDFSSVANGNVDVTGLVTDNFSNSTFTADIHHFGGGVLLKFKKAEITFGSVYSRGSQKVGKIVNFPGDDTNPDESVDVIWQRMRVLIGFSFPFASFGD